jgi:hypothetical protein
MDRTKLDRVLASHFTTEVAALSSYGKVYASKEPVELDEAVRAACESEDEYDRYVDSGFSDLPLDELLELEWDFGATALLEVLRLQSHFIVFDDEPFGACIFAALPVLEGVLEPFVESFFGTNGTEYGAPLMDLRDLARPGRIDPRTLRRARRRRRRGAPRRAARSRRAARAHADVTDELTARHLHLNVDDRRGPRLCSTPRCSRARARRRDARCVRAAVHREPGRRITRRRHLKLQQLELGDQGDARRRRDRPAERCNRSPVYELAVRSGR